MTVSDTGVKPQQAKSEISKCLILGMVGIVIIGLVLLGNWQLRRLDWKLELIERVEARAFARPVTAPTVSAWSEITRKKDEYRRVVIHGHFLHEQETLVWALTERGNGYWVLTPLLTPSGETVLINRGYVPVADADPTQRSAGQIEGEVSIKGLLRSSEPEGAPLRENDPVMELWYSRDVVAIAQARELVGVAPYFVDADKTDNPGGLPIGGMTRLDYRNVHLVYAMTWYGMALLLFGMTFRVIWLSCKESSTDI
jgi:surfeit locus 1 family protein